MDSLALYTMAQVAQFAVPVNATPVSTTSNGTASSGTTETFDAVLGYYQCSLVAGRRYMAVLNGLVGNCGTAGDIYQLQIRNSGSASNPTASSTLVAQQQWTSNYAGATSRTPVYVAGSFIAPATGTNTIGFSSTRTAGAGSFTPVSPPNLARELFVIYLGAV